MAPGSTFLALEAPNSSAEGEMKEIRVTPPFGRLFQKAVHGVQAAELRLPGSGLAVAALPEAAAHDLERRHRPHVSGDGNVPFPCRRGRAVIPMHDRVPCAPARQQILTEAQEEIFAVPREYPVQSDGQGQFLLAVRMGAAGHQQRPSLRGKRLPHFFNFGRDQRQVRGHEGIDDRIAATEIPDIPPPGLVPLRNPDLKMTIDAVGLPDVEEQGEGEPVERENPENDLDSVFQNTGTAKGAAGPVTPFWPPLPCGRYPVSGSG